MTRMKSGSRSSRRNRSVLAGLLIAVLAAALLAFSFGVSRWTEKTQTFTVTRVLDQPTSNCSTRSGQHSNCTTGHQYLVFADHGTYKDTDSIWFFKFNSSDLIGQLREGHTYRCDTTGFRFALGSSYRNLIHCTEATSP